jgi:hypothetical protein
MTGLAWVRLDGVGGRQPDRTRGVDSRSGEWRAGEWTKLSVLLSMADGGEDACVAGVTQTQH